MRLCWNDEIKKLAAGMLLFMTAGLLLGNIGMEWCKNQMRREYTLLAGSVLGTVRENYPKVPEEELIRMFDAGEVSDAGWETMARYGVFEEFGSQTFGWQEKNLRIMQIGGNLFLVTLMSLGVWGGMRYLKERQQKISGLRRYMEQLRRGAYRLELEDNGDDELSGLRNEIYRLTVLLKEQAALAQNQRKALADSVENISHQLKTPLTSVTVLADNLASDEEMDVVTRRRFLSEIIRQLSGMSWLIATMLKLSRLEAGVVELKREKVSAGKLVRDCIQRLETAAEWRGVRLESKPQEEVFLTADENWTLEALCNIMKNAIEHSVEGGAVEVGVTENEVYTEICISDRGVGITREERDKLFQRFYRGKGAAEDSAGIGLSLSKEIVERQNGHIVIESEEGQGTAFRLKFMK